MTGGLLQIVTSGKQDIYLTINPEITFFKKVFRRHTNFSLELKEINPEQTPEYNNNVTFILNMGDAIHRCYLEIDLPNLVFSDKYITDNNYTIYKTARITKYQEQVNLWNEFYNNLKGFCDIEIQLYRYLYILLQTDNITINILKDETNKFNYKTKIIKDLYKNKLEDSVYNLINITIYINTIDKLITNNKVYDPTKYINRLEILNQINFMYGKMIEYLEYYNEKKNENLRKVIELQKTNQINFNYAKFLGHNYFKNVTLEINGRKFEKYDNDILHINQMHRIKPDDMPNYLEMIGETTQLNDFNNNPKGGRKVLVPLIFWFNKDAGSSLPLVSMQYSTVVITAKINDIKKIIAFENYEKIYDDLIVVTIDNSNGFILNTNLKYNNYRLNPKHKSITYFCNYINSQLLQIQFPDLTTTEINIILENNGTSINSELVINKEQWVGFMININNPLYSTIAPKVGYYYPYINFDLYYSLIPPPKIKLISEVVFLDDVERGKFASSKLEYIIEKFNTDIFDIKNKNSFDCELSFNYPCKEILWYIQPQLYINGITENGENMSLLYDTYKYFHSDPVNSQKLTLNQIDLLLDNIDFNYWTYTLSYKFLNNILPNGVYYHSFCLYPEETQPSGTANMRHIKGKQYRIELNQNFLNEYNLYLTTLYKSNINLINNKKSILLKFIAKSYDLFVVHKGQVELIFDT
jgi:hypothetical protein